MFREVTFVDCTVAPSRTRSRPGGRLLTAHSLTRLRIRLRRSALTGYNQQFTAPSLRDHSGAVATFLRLRSRFT
jgi:hypothetical protein